MTTMNLPQNYHTLPTPEVHQRIAAAKEKLGRQVVVLGHHYQRDEVIQFADFRGDSLQLSRLAAAQEEARYIVFCGVRFMAETAAIVCGEGQVVIHPEPGAGCPLADFAQLEDVLLAWRQLAEAGVEGIVPVCYVNSSAEVKAFCGQHDGLTCTSANAGRVLELALSRGQRVLFLPDENLGRNTGRALGLLKEEIVTWDPTLPLYSHRGHGEHGGVVSEGEKIAALRRARLIVWGGYCHVHTAFSLADVERARREHPQARIIVHPECYPEVVDAADASGSTSFIVRAVEEAPPGSSFVIGTEVNLVNRLDTEHPDKQVIPLRRSLCPNMFRITARHLLYVLEQLVAGKPVEVVRLPEETIRWARVALERMLKL